MQQLMHYTSPITLSGQSFKDAGKLFRSSPRMTTAFW